MSVVLGLATLYNAWLRPGPRRASLDTAAFTGVLYWAAGLAAILFPNVSGLDPEFGGPGFPQGWLFAFFAACAGAGWVLETRV